ncbi:MAG: LLM class flavin-dependent oxidoreductase [Acidimicrobiales bacterium]
MNVALWYDFRNPGPWRQAYASLYSELLDQIEWVDDLGCFESVWLSEHHFTEDGYLPAVTPMMAAIAQRTRRIRIGTQVLLAPLHHPLRLAEEIAVVDQLSGGRVELGLAPGYRAHEFEVLGIPRQQRGSRTDETIELLLQAWTGEPFSHHGRHFDFDDVIVTPPPSQSPHPPIWIGGSSVAAAQRAVRFGAAFLADQGTPPEAIDAFVQAQRQLTSNNLRPLGTNRMIYVCDDTEQGWQEIEPHLRYQENVYEAWYRDEKPGPHDTPETMRERTPMSREVNIVGTPDEVVAEITRQHGDQPFDLLTFWARPPGLSISSSNRSIEMFAAEVEPRLSAL